MTSRTTTIALLIALLGVGSVQVTSSRAESPAHIILWTTLLFGIPVLMACLLTNQRWALMVAVMYGTVGLAMDISTIVQGLTKAEVSQMTLALSGLTGLLNFLLIVSGGKGFLNVTDASSPRGFPRPNPPSSSSS